MGGQGSFESRAIPSSRSPVELQRFSFGRIFEVAEINRENPESSSIPRDTSVTGVEHSSPPPVSFASRFLDGGTRGEASSERSADRVDLLRATATAARVRIGPRYRRVLWYLQSRDDSWTICDGCPGPRDGNERNVIRWLGSGTISILERSLGIEGIPGFHRRALRSFRTFIERLRALTVSRGRFLAGTLP
ncbi:hypothetical protein KM043_003898 [Ampulex compressa]|nr:hypothetical protein KM043_003898 [Ampulex compressa]